MLVGEDDLLDPILCVLEHAPNVVHGTPACEVRELRGLRGLRITGRSFDRPIGFDLHAAWRTHVEVGRG